MCIRRLVLWEALLSAVACAASAAPPPRSQTVDVLGEIDGLVREHFYRPQQLEKVGWSAAVTRARSALSGKKDASSRTTILRDLLSTLATSHTNYYPREDPAYWELMSIYERVVQRDCPKERTPGLPIAFAGTGVFWKQIGSSWFVGGVQSGSPAEVAGLQLGDEVVSANAKPFSPVLSFRAEVPVSLSVRRLARGPTQNVQITAQMMKPLEAFRKATAESWRMIERGGKRIAYLHVWVWSTIDVQQAVLDANIQSNMERADGFILDIRDGWGGAHANYLGIFAAQIPRLESIDRNGKSSPFDTQIRKPAIILINNGTRSGKELIAYGAKKHRLARLVGERTGGAVVFGRPFCLGDGSLLYLATSDALVDGERLEGRGVEPDVEVPFDVRYANGKDPQLEKALELLSDPAASNRRPTSPTNSR